MAERALVPSAVGACRELPVLGVELQRKKLFFHVILKGCLKNVHITKYKIKTVIIYLLDHNTETLNQHPRDYHTMLQIIHQVK
jgi:hypothetical protein